MEHLTEEQLVMHHYHDGESAAAGEKHLASCAECRAEYSAVQRVLALVDQIPVPERGAAYGEQMWNRLRWKLDRRRRRTWTSMLAAAAIIAIAFFAGQLWHARNSAPTPGQGAVSPVLEEASHQAPSNRDRVLLVVVSDHLDNSERMLQEVANADSKHSLDISADSERVADLVASNRIYRQTAAQQGDARIATLLSDLEPILVELSHADKLSADELKTLQKRIDSKGLLFKVRVVSAEANGHERPAAPKGTNSL